MVAALALGFAEAIQLAMVSGRAFDQPRSLVMIGEFCAATAIGVARMQVPN